MNRFAVVSMLGFALLGGPSCAPKYKVTSVIAVPSSPSEEEALKAALVGEGWKFTSTIYEDGRVEPAGALLFVHQEYGADGSFTYRVQGSPQRYTYKVEGKNIVTTHPGVKTMRVESISPNELKLFVYEMTLSWVMTR